MAEADLQRIGLLPDEQICLCDRPAANPSTHSGQRGNNSRYSPGLGAGASAITPVVVTAPTNGKNMTKFAMTAGTSGNCYFNYTLHTESSRLDFETEMACVINNPGSGGGRVDALMIRTTDGDIILRWVQGTGWLLRYRTGASGYSQSNLSAGLDIAGNEHTVRFVYTATDTAGANNGTCEVWIGSAGDSSLDTDTIGGSFTGMTKVADVAHACGDVSGGLRIGWIASNDTGLSNTANSGIYFRYIAPYMVDSTPVVASSGGVTWNKDAFLVTEKIDVEWDATANAGAGGWDMKIGIIWPQHYFDGSVTRRARARVWSSFANLGTGTSEIANTGSWIAVTPDAVGYCRTVLTIPGLLPDTTYWLETQLNGDSGGGGWFYKSTDATPDLHGCLRMPAKPGTAPTNPARIYASSCFNDIKWGPNELWSNGRTIGVGSGDGLQTHFRFFMGDWSYMDERSFDKSGTNQEGAETESQMKDTLFMLRHAYHVKSQAMKVFTRHVGDDHDRTVNDASVKHMLEEDASSWDRDRDTVAEAAWSDNVWGKGGVGTSNADYGFPSTIDDSLTEYTLTPRVVQLKLNEVNRQVFADTLPAVGTYRYDPSGVDLYGANQGASGDKFNSEDGQFTFIDMGNVRYVFLDTRLHMDRSNTSAGTLLGEAKTWVKAAISGSTLPGLVFVIPGYVQGVGAGATLKQNDNYATDEVGNSNFSAEKTEVFVTEVANNTAIKWAGVLTGDHHFLSIDQSVSALGSKYLFQIGSGGTQSQPHDPNDIDDNGYLLLTDGSDAGDTLTSSHVVRTMCYMEVTNETKGAVNVSAFRVANDALDTLGSFSLALTTNRSRVRDGLRSR